MPVRVNLRHGEATFSPLGRRWGGGAHGGPIVRLTAKRKSPFDAGVQIETTGNGQVASGCCDTARLHEFARDLQNLLIHTESAPASATFCEPPAANDDDARPGSKNVSDTLLSRMKTLLTRRSGVLRDLFPEPDDGSAARAALDGEIQGKACRVIQVTLRETPANCILRVEIAVGERNVCAFSNPQAIQAFLEELNQSGLVGA